MKCSSKTLQNCYIFPRSFLFVFHFVKLNFFHYECPDLCQRRQGNSKGEKWLHKMKKKESKLVFLYIKYSKFEAFVWHEAQTSDF